MKYRVLITRRAEKQLDEVPDRFATRIKRPAYALAENPRPRGSIKLKNKPTYRIRIGDYRVIYQIFDDNRIVILEAALHRSEAYK